jgi:hypothetical protein
MTEKDWHWEDAGEGWIKRVYNADDKRPETPALTSDMLPYEKEALSLMTKIGAQISRPHQGMVLSYFKMMRDIGAVGENPLKSHKQNG